jgi:phage-related baseplate assembly protein
LEKSKKSSEFKPLDLPQIIETPDFQAEFKDALKRFTESYRKIVPDFSEPTAADPIYHILIELTLNKVIGTEKINSAAYAQLVKLSNEIDFIFKGKIRPGESFEAYRDRMRGTKDQASTAGTPAMYKALTFLYGEASLTAAGVTRTASVMDAYVQAANGELLISVLINSDAADLKAAVVNALTDAFKKESVKPALDSVTFIEARAVPFSINAVISLQPGYSKSYQARIEENFKKSFEAQKKLGWAPTMSWIVRELHQPGVRSVILQSPATNIPVQADRYATITRLDLTVEESA